MASESAELALAKIEIGGSSPESTSKADEEPSNVDSEAHASDSEPSIALEQSHHHVGDARPSTLHETEMLQMAKEFVRVFREQHPDRRPPCLYTRCETGQEVLMMQLLRPTQVSGCC